jgi:hypothetical protein
MWPKEEGGFARWQDEKKDGGSDLLVQALTGGVTRCTAY